MYADRLREEGEHKSPLQSWSVGYGLVLIVLLEPMLKMSLTGPNITIRF